MEILCFFDNSGLHLCYQASQRLTSEAMKLSAVLRAGIRTLARS